MKPIDGALHFFKKGFKVFPVKSGGKTPAVKEWQSWAENATNKDILAFYKKYPFCNWGIFCGASGLTVLDIDVKNEGLGIKSFDHLQEVHGELPKTTKVKTPSGGFHLYFSGMYRDSASTIAPGIDTRGIGGYVLAPGSRIGSATYTLEEDLPILPFPEKIGKLIGREKKVLEEDDNDLTGERNNTLTSIAGTLRSVGLGYEAIFSALDAVNHFQLSDPLPEDEIKTIARSVARYKPDNAKAASDFLTIPKILAKKASLIDAKSIPKRDWILENRYIGGFISVIVAPGGVGKSSLTLLDALSICTGEPLSGFMVKKKSAVWLYNTEDPSDELERRVIAACSEHKVDVKELDKLHITSGRENPLILAKSDKSGIVINKTAMEEIITYIKTNKISLLIADPFVRTHEVSENDNMQIDKVVWVFQRIACKTGCAVGLVHHSRKPNGNGVKGDMHTARGASALINAARIAHTLSVMDEDEAEKFGIDPEKRGWYARFDSAKANLQPPAEKADWYIKKSVDLFNGDSVGTIAKIDLKDQTDELRKDRELAEAKDLARILIPQISKGEEINLAQAHSLLIINDSEHIFDLSERRLRKKMLKLISSGECKLGQKTLKHTYRKEEHKKHWIKWEMSDLSFLN